MEAHRNDRYSFSFPSIVFALGCAVALCATQGRSADLEVTAKVSQQVATIGSQIDYTISLVSHDAQIDSRQIQIPEMPTFGEGLRLGSARPQTSSRSSNLNGQWTHELDLTWLAVATKAGMASISNGRIAYRGETYDLTPLQVSIVRNAAEAMPPELASGDILPAQTNDASMDQQLRGKIFARLEVSKTDPYLQEPITVECVLYRDMSMANQVRNASWEPPDWKGFFAAEQDASRERGRETTVGGRRYVANTIGRFSLTPNQAGKLTIPLHAAQCALQVQRRRSSLFDDPFFDFGGFGAQLQPVRLPIAETTIDVKPLPADGRPASFQNAVGSFDFTASVDRSAMTTDDFLTLRIAIGGKGFLGSIGEPRLPDMPDWKLTETPSAKTEALNDNQALGGKKTFEFLLKAQKPGALTIPTISYAFFDPAERRYVEQHSDPFKIDVKKGADRKLLVAGGDATERTHARDSGGEVVDRIAYIHTDAPPASIAPPFYRRAFYLPLHLAPLALLALALAWRAWRLQAERHRDARELRGAGARARRELRGAAARLRKGELEQFHETLADAIRQFLATKMKRSAKGLTLEEIEAACLERGVREETAREMRRTLELCDQARYLPETVGSEAAGQTLEQAGRLLQEIDSAFAERKRRSGK